MTRRFLMALIAPVLSLQAAPLTPEQIAGIERVISAEMSRMSVPGLSIAIAQGDDIWTNGYGLSDLENFVPAKAATLYRTASIAKPMTAVAILQQVEQGRLKLDEDVHRYVTGFPKKPYAITVRQLMGHLGGIRSYRRDEPDNTHYYTGITDAMRVFQDDDLISEPGTKYTYSTYGYVLLGAVLEAGSGVPYLDYMQANVFRPAGMTMTQADDVYRVILNRTRGYRKTSEGIVQNANLHDTSVKIPGGGLLSTASDLVRFALALNAGRLLQSGTLETMYTPLRTRDGVSTGYGLGWGIGQWRGHPRYSHSGGQAGTATLLVNLPQDRTVVAVMLNLQGADVRSIVDRVLEVVLPASGGTLSRSTPQ